MVHSNYTRRALVQTFLILDVCLFCTAQSRSRVFIGREEGNIWAIWNFSIEIFLLNFKTGKNFINFLKISRVLSDYLEIFANLNGFPKF